jgi:hypothetical protein
MPEGKLSSCHVRSVSMDSPDIFVAFNAIGNTLLWPLDQWHKWLIRK